MNPERLQRIQELYNSARDREPAARQAFLIQACGDDADLRSEVESLLAQNTHSVMDQPAIELAADLLVTQSFDSGTLLGPYRIEGVLGAGGMGRVYRATDTRLGRTVAIKVAQERFTNRFEREARVIATLNHPNICTLYDVGPNYLVMEFIEGQPLTGPLPVEQAIAYAGQILDALEAAHAKGIVHRDLKPANILASKTGVKLLDFGLAKQAREAPGPEEETHSLSLTQVGAVLGTPAYMAPEQWDGKPADTRSDIYTFGCMLYEMLTGKRAGADRTPVKPAALETVLRKCLARNPEQRWQTAAEIKPQLQRALPNPLREYGMAAAKVILTAAAAILLVLGGFRLWQRWRAAPLTDQDVLVLADFTNTTGDAVFDTTLRERLAGGLQESPFLKVMGDEQTRRTLQLMGRPSNQRITNAIAHELCVRTGEKATIGGSIASRGETYEIALAATNCQTGATLARERTEAKDKDHVLAAVDTATAAMRAKLGESLSSIGSSGADYDLTTPSLDAFQAYAQGFERMRQGAFIEAVPFFTRATELDPNFGSAYFLQGIMYHDIAQGGNSDRALNRAFSLIDRVSEQERLDISGNYYLLVTGQLDKAAESAGQEARAYPRWFGPHITLCAIYEQTGDLEKSLHECQEALRLEPEISLLYGDVMNAFAEVGRFDEAKAVGEQALARKMDSEDVRRRLLIVAYDQGDPAAAQEELQWMMGKPQEFNGLITQARYAAQRGQFSEEQRLFQQASGLRHRQGLGGAGPSLEEQALLDNCGPIRALARAHPPNGVGQAVPVALCGETEMALKVADEAAKQRPLDTVLNAVDLPTLRAAIELRSQQPQKAVESLAPAVPYERRPGGAMPVYLRGLAYLEAKQGPEAAAEFQRVLDRNPFYQDGLVHPLAYVGLARAAKLSGDSAKAKQAYQDFFGFWKDADKDVPILITARKEYAALP